MIRVEQCLYQIMVGSETNEILEINVLQKVSLHALYTWPKTCSVERRNLQGNFWEPGERKNAIKLIEFSVSDTMTGDYSVVGSMEASSKAFLLLFLLPDWLKLNHLRSCNWMECDFSDIFSRHICSTVAETIGVTNNAASFGSKNVQKTTFEAAEMILITWNQQ